MKNVSIILFFICFGSGHVFGQGVLDVSISADFQNRPFIEILNEIEKEHQIIFFYQKKWISDIKVSKKIQNIPLSKVIGDILNENKLSFIVFNPHSIFIINEIPDLIEKNEIPVVDTPPGSVVSEEEGIEKIVVGNTQNRNRKTDVVLRGFIKDTKSGEGIFGSTVFVQELGRGTSSNEAGFYSLTIPRGNYNIAFSSIGFKREIKQVVLNDSGNIDVELSETAVQMDDVIITGEAEDTNVSSVQMSMTRLSMKTIESLPAFLGEVDVIKSLTLLPSVSTIGEGASGFNVRGGDIDQNLILLDGAPIFNSSHVFGFFSVFNPDAVKEVTLYTGGISAKYGGRLSSILDIKQNEGNLKKITGKGGLGVVSSRLALEAPIVKDKSSVLVAGRSSYSDWLLKMAPDLEVKNSSVSFYDLMAKTNYAFNDKNKFSFHI